MKILVNKCFNLIKDHILITVCIVVVIIALPIFVSVLAPWCSSEITADGLLGYIIEGLSAIGTIFLAYVAVCQNEQFKEENDKAQKRLEDISKQANELSVIGKVIDYETGNLKRFSEQSKIFLDTCDPGTIVSCLYKATMNKPNLGLELEAEMLKGLVRKNYSALCNEFKYEPRFYGSNDRTRKAISGLHDSAIGLIDRISEATEATLNGEKQSFEKELRVVLDASNEFRTAIDIVVTAYRLRLDFIIYNKMSYDEIIESRRGDAPDKANEMEENWNDET